MTCPSALRFSGSGKALARLLLVLLSGLFFVPAFAGAQASRSTPPLQAKPAKKGHATPKTTAFKATDPKENVRSFDIDQSLPFFGHSLLLLQTYILLLAACATLTAERLHRQTFGKEGTLENRTGFWERTMRGAARADKLAQFYFQGRVKVWPSILNGIRWLLLLSLCLPAIVLWRSRIGHEMSFARVVLPAAVLAAAALFSRRTPRAWGTVSLSIVSGACIFILFWGLFSPSLLRLRALPFDVAGAGLHFQNGEMAVAGYLIGFALIFSTSLAMGADLRRGSLFDTPPLEHRAINPLQAPLPLESRKRLRIFCFNAVVAIALAVSPLGLTPLPFIVLVLASMLHIWGWRHKRLGPRQLLPAVLATAAVSLVLWVFSSASDISALSKTLAHSALVSDGLFSRSPAATLALLEAGGLAARAPVIAACLLVLLVVCGTLMRPPGHLWTILGHAPAWGWMLLAAAIAASFASVFILGPEIAKGMLVTALSAFLFVWLEGAELL